MDLHKYIKLHFHLQIHDTEEFHDHKIFSLAFTSQVPQFSAPETMEFSLDVSPSVLV
jgi:hypothetical protein